MTALGFSKPTNTWRQCEGEGCTRMGRHKVFMAGHVVPSLIEFKDEDLLLCQPCCRKWKGMWDEALNGWAEEEQAA